MTATLEATIACGITGEIKPTKLGKNGPKLPRGWKRFGDRVWSQAAWKDQFCLRMFYLPIRKPSDGDWKELDGKLREAWGRSTSTLQWAYKTLLANDISREPGVKKIPAMPKIYLYGLRDWHGWASSANCLLTLAEQTYRARRYDIVWRGNASLPRSTYPQPFPVHAASWRPSSEDNGDLKVAFPLINERVEVILKTHRHERAAKILRAVIDGQYKATEAKVYKGKKGDTMFGFGAWVPRQQPNQKASGDLFVRTDSENFLLALNAKDERLWVLSGDRARQTLVKRDRAQERFRDDLKFERRPMDRVESDRQLKIAQKQHDRIDDFVRQSVNQVVSYASRRNLANVIYDGTDKSYFRKFPWFQFEQQLKNKCQQAGIGLTLASAK